MQKERWRFVRHEPRHAERKMAIRKTPTTACEARLISVNEFNSLVKPIKLFKLLKPKYIK